MLNKIVYPEGTEIQDHVKLLRTRKAMVDNLSTDMMTDKTWRGIIIRSIPPTPKWLPVIPSLYAMSSSADIISTLFTHGMIIRRDTTKPTLNNQSNTALAARIGESCTNLGCKAKKCSTHTIANCYWPRGSKEGQFPPNFGQRNRVNVAASSGSTPTPPEHFVLSAYIPKSSGQSGVVVNIPTNQLHRVLISQSFQTFQKGKVPTFIDSGASNTMFVSRDVFTEYKAIAPCVGDSAKADNGSFEIIGEGSVTQ